MQLINEKEMEWTQVSEKLRIKYLLKDYAVMPNLISSGVSNWAQGKAGEPHVHPEHDEIYIVLRGKGLANILGEVREVGPGDMLHAKAGELHGMVEGLSEGGIEMFYALIPREDAREREVLK
ncbi:MAG: Cupin domain [Bacillota bacterium]|jgi:oxalate decarboxylase/phosphoglucose isomerase-like protein (cupin superfamily)|nr:Cupin domain [Bacillota bacterium]